MSPRRSGRDSGFTLLEITVALAVLSVVAALAVPILLSQDERAEVAALQSELSSAASLLVEAQRQGDALPSEMPAGIPTVLPNAGSFAPTFTMTVVGEGNLLCVEGATSGADVWSYGVTSGLRQAPCPVPFGIAYGEVIFVGGVSEQTVAPTVLGHSGDVTYSYSGVLPMGVSFDTATGVFTGPTAEEWSFQITQIGAGGRHTCAILVDGTVRCWGENYNGQVGDGSNSDRWLPVEVPGLTGVVDISGGGNNSCAVTDTFEAYCWGANNHGQVGDGSNSDRGNPVLVSTDAAAIANGIAHTCSVTTAGDVMCWGSNIDGQIGDGTKNARLRPVTVLSGARDVALGNSHACALMLDSTVMCWGNNYNGQIGDGSGKNRLTPVTVPGLSDVATIAAGGNDTCVTTGSGDTYCWGENYHGQVGNGASEDATTPILVDELPTASNVAVGITHACANTTVGTAECWGSRAVLGGDGILRRTPSEVTGLANVTSIASGSHHACAVLDTGEAYCWGANGSGGVGDGTNTNRYSPVPVSGSGYGSGFPSTVQVTATDSTGAVSTTNVTLNVLK